MTLQEPRNAFYAAQQMVRHHASGGNVLILATALALIVANVPLLSDYYNNFWTQPVRMQVGDFNIFSHGDRAMTMIEFINDALMAIFFFSIGLEIKREVLVGELSSLRQALLPIMGAIGGMAFPVGIYFLLAHGTAYADGAAIPMATDIAFSLGVLAMLGRRVPISLKIFLTTLAVVDDIGGIIVIAVFYSSHIELMLLVYATAILCLLFFGSRLGIRSKAFYLLLGAAVWFLFLNSGIHPTIAGVLVAFCIPATPVVAPKKYVKMIRRAIGNFRGEDDELLNRRSILSKDQMNWLKEVESAGDKVISPLQDLEDTLHPVVNYIIIPLFAFANAGIYLLDINPITIVEGISLAIICGLVLGKTLGIFTVTWLAVKLKWAPMPEHTDWKIMASISLLAGIGFTVSLFIANLSFPGGTPMEEYLLSHAKIGIVTGSLIAGIGGYLALSHFLPAQPADPDTD